MRIISAGYLPRYESRPDLIDNLRYAYCAIVSTSPMHPLYSCRCILSPACPFLRYWFPFYDQVRDLRYWFYGPLACFFVCFPWYSVISARLSDGEVPDFLVYVLFCVCLAYPVFRVWRFLNYLGDDGLLSYFSYDSHYPHCAHFPFLVRYVLVFLAIVAICLR